MDTARKLTVNEKALAVNLDPHVYGSFSEIGAGQEVAANFFQAGGASGTIALTQSAYDKKISNAIYGEGKRFVSKQRLVRMMEHDYANITDKLSDRKDDTCFFAFADTIETLNFHKTNQGHGWMGITFQRKANTAPNQIVMHVILHDNDPLLQQKAVGRLGVNLVHGVYNKTHSIKEFLTSLMDGLSRSRVEIDMFNIIGPDFENVDNRLISLKLVKLGLTPVAMFGPDGNNVQASEILYKKNLLVLRGRFRPPTLVNVDMLLAGYRQFVKEEDVVKKDLIVLSELSLNNLLMGDDQKKERDYMDRVDILCSLGQTVIITNYQHYYKLTNYLSDVNRGRKIGVLMGVNNLEAIFNPTYYKNLKGGILESFGRLFGRNIKLLIYPATDAEDGSLHTCENVQIDKTLMHLFMYLIENNQIEDIKNCNRDLLTIFSDDVLEMIGSNKAGWEKMVPNKVARTIKSNGMFGYSSN
ncbi:TonB-dependent receptor [bacterium SCSIO 12643]|nr:TonB-dependent receptor [bacterium SCSIO 12643]